MDSILINISASDLTSGVKTLELRNGTANWIIVPLEIGNALNGYYNITFDTKSVADGALNLTIRATDFAGNVNDTKHITVNVDNTSLRSRLYLNF